MSVTEIQQSLREAGLGGWLFYDFRGSDPLARSILGLERGAIHSRRWFYFVPAAGEPTKLVHAIEAGTLDSLAGGKRVYLKWQELQDELRRTLDGARRIAMQFSPHNAIPYVCRVDAGTIDLVRSFGVEVVSSADLVSRFEATIDEEQFRTHAEAADRLGELVDVVFAEIGRRGRQGVSMTEHDIQRFMLDWYASNGLVADHAPIVAVGPHSADPHYAPSQSGSAPIQPGDFVLIDTWAKFDRPGAIYADITWTGYVGRPVPEKYVRIFEIVRQARDAAVDAVRRAQSSGVGIRGCDVDDGCRAVIEEAGYGEFFRHRTGHSIHENTHGNGANLDNLETQDQRWLLPRTLFSVEPGIYLPGEFGVRSEIDVFLPDASNTIVTGRRPQTAIIEIG